MKINQRMKKKKGVFIERAEPLTKEGIFAMGLNDREYFIFNEGRKQGRKQTFIEEKKRVGDVIDKKMIKVEEVRKSWEKEYKNKGNQFTKEHIDRRICECSQALSVLEELKLKIKGAK